MEGDPAIILVSREHGDVLLEEFRSRYERDYDLRNPGHLPDDLDQALRKRFRKLAR